MGRKVFFKTQIFIYIISGLEKCSAENATKFSENFAPHRGFVFRGFVFKMEKVVFLML